MIAPFNDDTMEFLAQENYHSIVLSHGMCGPLYDSGWSRQAELLIVLESRKSFSTDIDYCFFLTSVHFTCIRTIIAEVSAGLI
jgi:hypothetical protein